MSSSSKSPVPPFIPSSNVMTNGYFGGVTMESATLNYVPNQAEEVVSLKRSVDLGYITSTTIDNDESRNKEAEEIKLTETQSNHKNMSAKMKEYNINFNGLVIIPWEEFSADPQKINDLFFLENNGHITYDPEEVNVFFHAAKMNKPTFGDISENGKSWIVNVESIRDVEQVRVWLMERVSVFGVTLLRKTSRFGNPEKAPCLVMMDPSMGHSDSIHAMFMRCINVMQDGKKFCLEIDLNGCVERWCRRITMTRCEAVGAKLVVTNGEEPANLTDAENIFCCIVCFPIWSIQAGIYKLHRRAQYKDFEIKFDADELFLYGALGGVRNQRAKLFRDYTKDIFRTKPMEEAGEDFRETNVDRQRINSAKKTLRRSNSQNRNQDYIENETSDCRLRENPYIQSEKNSHAVDETSFSKTSINQHNEIYSGHSDGKRSLEIRNDLSQTEDKHEIHINLRENTNSSESSDVNNISRDGKKFQSFLEVESCTLRKELSPLPSVRTVNSDIMIITQSNDEGTPNGSEIDLKTFIKTELSSKPEKTKKKTKRQKRGSKPPKSPTKKNKNKEQLKEGVDNTGFEADIDNKFRRTLPSKRRSFESLETLDTLGSTEQLYSEKSATASRDSLENMLDLSESKDTLFSDNEVLSLKPEVDSEVATLAQSDDNCNEVDIKDDSTLIFQLNKTLPKEQNNLIHYEKSDDKGDRVLTMQDDMSCDDLEFSDLDADDEDVKETTDNNDSTQNTSSRNIRKLNTMRGTQPYRSSRQKYIGMNTSVKNGRIPSLKVNK